MITIDLEYIEDFVSELTRLGIKQVYRSQEGVEDPTSTYTAFDISNDTYVKAEFAFKAFDALVSCLKKCGSSSTSWRVTDFYAEAKTQNKQIFFSLLKRLGVDNSLRVYLNKLSKEELTQLFNDRALAAISFSNGNLSLAGIEDPGDEDLEDPTYSIPANALDGLVTSVQILINRNYGSSTYRILLNNWDEIYIQMRKQTEDLFLSHGIKVLYGAIKVR
jgi:hypothetical protein